MTQISDITLCDWPTAPSMGEEARASALEGVIALNCANSLKRLTANVTAITPSGASRLLPHRGGGEISRNLVIPYKDEL